MHNTGMQNKPQGEIAQGRLQPDKVRVVQQSDYREDYANSVQVNVSVWDFFLQFGKLKVSGPNDVTFSSFMGVYMSPQQAKALHLVLSQNIAQYESTFGTIQIDNPKPDATGRTGLVQ